MKLKHKLFLAIGTIGIPLGAIGGTLTSCGHHSTPSSNPGFDDFKTAAAAETAVNIVNQTHPKGWDKNIDSDHLNIISHSEGTNTYTVVIRYTGSQPADQTATFVATYITDTKYDISAWTCKTPPVTNWTFDDFAKAAADETAVNIIKKTKPAGWDSPTDKNARIATRKKGTNTYTVTIEYMKSSDSDTEIATFVATYITNTKYDISAWQCTEPPAKDKSFARYKGAIEESTPTVMWATILSYNSNHPSSPLPHINANLQVDLDSGDDIKYDDTSEPNTVILVVPLKSKGDLSVKFQSEIKLRAVWNNSEYNITDWTLNYTFTDFKNSFTDLVKNNTAYLFSFLDIGETDHKWTENNSTIGQGTIDPQNPNRYDFIITHYYYYHNSVTNKDEKTNLKQTLNIYAEMKKDPTTKLVNIFGGNGGYEAEVQHDKANIDYFKIYQVQAKGWGQNTYGFRVVDVLQDLKSGDKMPQDWGILIENTAIFTGTLDTDGNVGPNPDAINKKLIYRITAPANSGKANNQDLNLTLTEKNTTGSLPHGDSIQRNDFTISAVQPAPNVPPAAKTWLNDAKTKLSTYKGTSTNDHISDFIHIKNKNGDLQDYPNLAKLFSANKSRFGGLTTLVAAVQSTTINYKTRSVEFTVLFYKEDTNWVTPLGGQGGKFSYAWPGGTTTAFDIVKEIPIVNHDIDAT